MNDQLVLWPASPIPGRLAVRDEGGHTVRLDMYTNDGLVLGVDVPRERLIYYAKQLLEAGLRQ